MICTYFSIPRSAFKKTSHTRHLLRENRYCVINVTIIFRRQHEKSGTVLMEEPAPLGSSSDFASQLSVCGLIS